MAKINKLLKTAKLLEWTIKYAQEFDNVGSETLSDTGQSAQAGDIESALKSAGLWEKSNDVAPLLNAAGVPDDAKVSIVINVNNKLNVSFTVLLDPTNPNPAKKLQQLVSAKFAVPMKSALQKAGLSVADVVILKWMSF